MRAARPSGSSSMGRRSQ